MDGTCRNRLPIIGIISVLWLCQPVLGQMAPAHLTYGEPRELGVLANKQIVESSGLAASRVRPDVFWTHNDSGDSPRLFAFDQRGRDVGEYSIPGAKAVDWEDLASFTRQGQCLLLVADVGDNLERRGEYQLYLISEPVSSSDKPRLVQVIRFHYEDGPHNCESVGVDPVLGCVLLVSKRRGPTCHVYQLDLPKPSSLELGRARRIATLSIPWPTAMDVSPDGSRAVILTYTDAYEFVRRPQEDWKGAFARESATIHMPTRLQGEAICYGADEESLFLTSEKGPSPLWIVPVKQGPRALNE